MSEVRHTQTRTFLLRGTAVWLTSCLLACTAAEAPSVAARSETPPTGDQAQVEELVLVNRMRPDVIGVLHAHTPELVTFGQSTAKLRPVLNTALFIGDGLPIYDITQFTGGAPSPVGCSWCISTPQLGRALAMVMGNKDGSLLLDHGIALVGP